MARLYSSSTFFSPLRMLHQWSVYFLTRNNKEIQCVGDPLLIMLRSSSGFAWCQSAPPLSSSQSFILGFRCRKGYPAQGLRVSSCLTLGNELSEEIHMLTEQGPYREGAPGRRAGQGTQEDCSATGLAVSDFIGMGIFLGCLWPIILTQGTSW